MADDYLPAGFQPSVFDRLIDADSVGTADRRGYTESQLMDVVRRDLEDLLNTRRPTFHELGVDEFQEVQTSIVGFGLPDFSNTRGLTAETRNRIAREVEKAISNFEPRLTDIVVTVRDPMEMENQLKDKYQQMSVYFHVEAKLRMDPCPPVAFETVLELAQGRHVVRPAGE